MFISAFLSPYDELFNIKQNFKMKKYMPLEGLRWSRDSGSTLCDTPQNGRSRTGWGGGGGELAALFQADNKGLEPVFEHPVILILRVGHKDDHLRAIGQTWAQAHAFVVGQ